MGQFFGDICGEISRLLSDETIARPGRYSWPIHYDLGANGHAAGVTAPDGLQVTYAPERAGPTNRGGQRLRHPRQRHHLLPHGAIKQFTYGNGIVHTVAQNTRQLPARSIDGDMLDLEAAFDAHGNVDHIIDRIQGTRYDRQMAYDGLDRLDLACSPICGGTGGCHRTTYDALDNLRVWE